MRKILIAFLMIAGPALAQDTTPPPDAPPVPLAVTPESGNPPMSGPRLLVSTAMGDIVLQLDAVHAPKSVANILRYVKEKHFDGTAVYRVASGFVIQMGSWDMKMKYRPVHPGPVPLEANNGLSNLRGTVALARTASPNSANAEFFINLVDNGRLNHAVEDTGNSTGYAVFGQVASGMDVVDKIAAAPVGDHGPMPGQAPVDPILIKKIAVLK